MLKRFWFKFDISIEDSTAPFGLLIGCGVTALDYNDALRILDEKVFKGDVPEPKLVVEDISIASLDQRHVVPNMGNPAIRGVWFPLGYA